MMSGSGAPTLFSQASQVTSGIRPPVASPESIVVKSSVHPAKLWLMATLRPSSASNPASVPVPTNAPSRAPCAGTSSADDPGEPAAPLEPPFPPPAPAMPELPATPVPAAPDPPRPPVPPREPPLPDAPAPPAAPPRPPAAPAAPPWPPAPIPPAPAKEPPPVPPALVAPAEPDGEPPPPLAPPVAVVPPPADDPPVPRVPPRPPAAPLPPSMTEEGDAQSPSTTAQATKIRRAQSEGTSILRIVLGANKAIFAFRGNSANVPKSWPVSSRRGQPDGFYSTNLGNTVDGPTIVRMFSKFNDSFTDSSRPAAYACLGVALAAFFAWCGVASAQTTTKTFID